MDGSHPIDDASAKVESYHGDRDEENRPHGQGRMSYIESDLYGRLWYEGKWKNGEWHGQGEVHWTSGSRYKGEFAHGCPHGRGEMTWEFGARYTGQYEGGQRCGEGTYMYPLDDKHGRHRFKGFWKENKKNGKGVMEWTSGQVYEGNWENGYRCGQGTISWADGARFTGEWAHDMRNGKGLLKWPDGETFEGRWCNNAKDGIGVVKLADGSMHAEIWENGRLRRTYLLRESLPASMLIRGGIDQFTGVGGGSSAQQREIEELRSRSDELQHHVISLREKLEEREQEISVLRWQLVKLTDVLGQELRAKEAERARSEAERSQLSRLSQSRETAFSSDESESQNSSTHSTSNPGDSNRQNKEKISSDSDPQRQETSSEEISVPNHDDSSASETQGKEVNDVTSESDKEEDLIKDKKESQEEKIEAQVKHAVASAVAAAESAAALSRQLTNEEKSSTHQKATSEEEKKLEKEQISASPCSSRTSSRLATPETSDVEPEEVVISVSGDEKDPIQGAAVDAILAPELGYEPEASPQMKRSLSPMGKCSNDDLNGEDQDDDEVVKNDQEEEKKNDSAGSLEKDEEKEEPNKGMTTEPETASTHVKLEKKISINSSKPHLSTTGASNGSSGPSWVKMARERALRRAREKAQSSSAVES